METSGLGAAGVAYAPSPEKYWHEKGVEERALKLGEAVEYLTREVREMRNELTILRGHEHKDDGRMVVPVLQSLMSAGQREEPYFFRNPLGRENKF